MKTLITLLLALASLAGFAQTRVQAPAYFIDSVQTDNAYLNYLDHNDIAAVNVSKDNKYPNGAIFITFKDHRRAMRLLRDKPLSLNNIREANISNADKRKPVLYLVDDKLLTDTAGVRIPSMFVKNVTVVKASETAYFKTALPNVLLIRISTKPPQIMIRGLAAAK